MKRIMMAGMLGGMMALIYFCTQSGIIYTKMRTDVFDLEEKKEDAVKNLSDQCIDIDFKAAFREAEKNTHNAQFSLQETPDGYELVLYDREKQEVFSMVYPKEPWVKEVSEGVLEIGISMGSPVRYTFYFRKEDGKISDIFYNGKVFGEQYIAHRPKVGEQWDEPLILTDIFEEGILYQEIHRDFSVTADLMSAIYNIELVDEGHVMLEYCVGEDYTVIDEVVGISESGG